MKKLIITIGVISMTMLMSANAQNRSGRTRPDAYSKPSGGLVEKPYSGNYFRIVNAQRTVPDEKIRSYVLKMRLETLLPFESQLVEPIGMEAARHAAETLVGEARVGAGFVVVDDPKCNTHIESAEGHWAVLNIAPLKTDFPEVKTLETRCAKMLWRAAARTLGVGYSAHDPTVLKPFSTLAELDANLEMKPSPDGSNAMLRNAVEYGMTPLTIASYRTACRNGWAPAPTNDVQRTIWNQIHAIPDKPITIEFDPKKDK